MKKLLKLVSKFVDPKDIVNHAKEKLYRIQFFNKKTKFLDKLFSYEVKNSLDDVHKMYNDIFKQYNK